MHSFKGNTSSNQPAKAAKHARYLQNKNHSYSWKHTELFMKI